MELSDFHDIPRSSSFYCPHFIRLSLFLRFWLTGLSYLIQVGLHGASFFLYFFKALCIPCMFLFPMELMKVSRGDIFGGGAHDPGFYGNGTVCDSFPRISMDVAPWVQGGLLWAFFSGSVWVLSKGLYRKYCLLYFFSKYELILFLGSPEGLVGGIFCG